MKKKQSLPSIWSEARCPRADAAQPAKAADDTNASQPKDRATVPASYRSIFQQDYDRLLFSTPVRRLADKTQVWPMEENDGVRTRLTHSHEVANLARSLGTRVFKDSAAYFKDQGKNVDLYETVQPILLTIGLGHDLGNPPFGHQGEIAIGRWFSLRTKWIFTHINDGGNILTTAVPKKFWSEFTEFDGNPQSLRLLTKLQTHIDGIGLDLSAATLAAGLKYPVHVSRKDKNKAFAKKGGYFNSEKDIVDWIREETGLKEGARHPLTWIMEACDDIAYSVLDVDDLLKKGMISPDDILVILRRKFPKNQTVVLLDSRFTDVENKLLPPEIQRDIKTQLLRAHLIDDLIGQASSEFKKNAAAIFSHHHEKALMDNSMLCKELQSVAKQYAFGHSAVLRAEALGAIAVDGLMTAIWDAISDRDDQSDLKSKRRSARAKYIFSKISPNYIEQAVKSKKATESTADLRYRELRLLTDMVSGMTDTFAVRLWKDIRAISNDQCA